MEYQKINENRFKVIESKTEVREQEYSLDDLLLDERNLLASLSKVRDLIKEAKKLGIE